MSVRGYVNLDTGAAGITKMQVEVLGTCFVTLALFGLAYDTTMGALGCGVMLALWTYLGGGHYNPAVTVAYAVRDGFDAKSVAAMAGAQVTGAIIAVLFASTVGVGAQSNDSTQSVASSVVEALFVLQLTLTYFASSDALAVGLSYFSGLAAYAGAGATMGNPAIVLGVAIGNAILGNGFELSNAAIIGSVVPLVAGASTPYVLDSIGKQIPRFLEGFGTFYLTLGIAGIVVGGGGGAALAIGTTLATWMAIGPGAYNPAVTLARFVKRGDFSVWMDPVLDIVAQVVGGTLGAIVASWAMGAGAASVADLGTASIIDILATAALALTYFAGASAIDTGLTYFGLLVAFGAAASSSFNPALPIGAYLAGLAGVGGAAPPLSPVVGPVVGAIVAGLSGAIPKIADEAIAVFFLYLAVGTTSGTYGTLARGAMVLAFTKISSADLNPLVTVARDGLEKSAVALGLQLAGATLAGLLGAFLSTGMDGTASDDFAVKAMSAELLAAVLLARIYASNASRDAQALGLSYFALLAAFGSAMGSVANPALVFGQFVGDGLLGSGFDFSTSSLVTFLAHFLTPLVGALLSKPLFALIEDGEVGKLLGKLSFGLGALNPGELFGSFFLIVTFSAVGDNAFARGVGLMALLFIYNQHDLLPTITIARIASNSRPKVEWKELVMSTLAQTLGATLAIYTATWLTGAPAAPADASELNSAVGAFLLAVTFSLGWLAGRGNLATGLSYFVAASVFSGPLNPAYVLANCLVGAIGGGGIALDASLAAGLLVPLAGGAAGGFLSAYIS